ncbi:MAG: TonB-dependent receptor domain-containing protein [Halothiobacillaceae bacterium]
MNPSKSPCTRPSVALCANARAALHACRPALIQSKALVLGGLVMFSPVLPAWAGTMDPIVVTPNRAAQTVDESLSSVTVIDRAEIERLQPVRLVDLLRGRAGLDVADNGPYGQLTSLFLRGGNAAQTLLLVDGVRMTGGTDGRPSWEFLPLSQIDRIEIVRGPRTSVYGADAVGGVVQVFTRAGQAGGPQVGAEIGAGSLGTFEAAAGIGGGTEDTRLHLSASHFRTDGIDVLDGIGDSDRDGFDNTAFSARFSHRFSDRLSLFASALRSQGRSDFDADFGPDATDYVQQGLRAGLRGLIGRHGSSELSFSTARDDRKNFSKDRYVSRADMPNRRVDWRNDFSLGDSVLLTAGLDWLGEYVDAEDLDPDYGFDGYERDRRHNRGAYLMAHGDWRKHRLSGSFRHDRNSQFGNHNTGQIAWGHDLTETLSSRVSWGTAFRAPSFLDLYYPGFANPDLAPETARTAEAGLRWTRDRAYADLAAFETRVDDLIVYSFASSRPENINRARMRGLELETGYANDLWQLALSATLLRTEDRDTGNRLPRRAGQTLRLDVDRQLGRWSIGGTVAGRSHSFNDADNRDRLAGYGLLDLRASYRFDRDWTLQATVDNVLDREYATANAYRYEPDFSRTAVPYADTGRTFFLRLTYRPQS